MERNGKKLTVTIIEGDLKLKEITDRYYVDLNEGEPEEYHATRPYQYHAYYKTEKNEHTLKVRYKIDK